MRIHNGKLFNTAVSQFLQSILEGISGGYCGDLEGGKILRYHQVCQVRIQNVLSYILKREDPREQALAVNYREVGIFALCKMFNNTVELHVFLDNFHV